MTEMAVVVVNDVTVSDVIHDTVRSMVPMCYAVCDAMCDAVRDAVCVRSVCVRSVGVDGGVNDVVCVDAVVDPTGNQSFDVQITATTVLPSVGSSVCRFVRLLVQPPG